MQLLEQRRFYGDVTGFSRDDFEGPDSASMSRRSGTSSSFPSETTTALPNSSNSSLESET